MKIQFLTPVWHGADCYREGDAADIDDEEADALIHQGLAESVIEAEDTDPADPADPAAEVPVDANGGSKE